MLLDAKSDSITELTARSQFDLKIIRCRILYCEKIDPSIKQEIKSGGRLIDPQLKIDFNF